MGTTDRLGVGPGDLVAVALPPGPSWPSLVGDLWSAGVAFLPVDVRLASREHDALLDRARPSVVLSEEGRAVRTDGAAIDPGTAVVVATSGTAGRPRAVELSRRAIEAAIAASAQALGAGRADPWVSCLTPAHVGGLLVLLRGVVLGAQVTVLERFDERALLERSPEGALVPVVPSMLRRLVETGEDLSRLRAVLVGGAALDGGIAARATARGTRVVATYGLTETAGGVVYDGRPLEGTELRVADDGEILVRGPTLMEGYRFDPVATAAAFTLDGWLRTGDAGELADDGTLRVRGRLDDAIRTGGETVWPQEVERALRDHPAVAEVAVAGRPDAEWGQQVVAFVVPSNRDRPPTLEDLRDHAAGRVARFKAPRELVLVPSLPRTASGKLRRTTLRRVGSGRDPDARG